MSIAEHHCEHFTVFVPNCLSSYPIMVLLTAMAVPIKHQDISSRQAYGQ
jgi:hypothetical protein